MGSNISECGLVIGLSCLNGIKYIFFLLISFPMFSKLVDSPSLVAIPITNGFSFLKFDFAAVSTGVSTIPFASFPIVFPRAWCNHYYIC